MRKLADLPASRSRIGRTPAVASAPSNFPTRLQLAKESEAATKQQPSPTSASLLMQAAKESALEQGGIEDFTPANDGRGLAMVDRPQDRVEYLEERIHNFAAAVEGPNCGPFGSAMNVPIQDASWFVGRICAHSEGRLDPSSVYLEGSIKFNQGHRTRLDLSRLDEYHLFPGQIVAVEGVNPTGHVLLATRLCASAPMDPCPSIHEGACKLTLVVACGPFTQSTNLDYNGLDDLLSVCTASKPDLLLLLGPFVDTQHPLAIDGSATQSFEDTFRTSVVTRLEAADGVGAVALVPSSRDAHHAPEMPQSPMASEPRKGISQLCNPATFGIGGVTVGVVTVDLLRHISSRGIERGGSSSGRLAALASHVIWQRNYMPLYPSPAGAVIDSTGGARLRLPFTPDILVVPSDLNSFAKAVPTSATSETVCINPGRVVKGTSRGNFAVVRVAADKAEMAAVRYGKRKLSEFCSLEISRA